VILIVVVGSSCGASTSNKATADTDPKWELVPPVQIPPAARNDK
jgi:hypothetical protein